MMRAIFCWLLLAGSAFAQGGMGPGPGTPHTTSGGSFVGLIDQESTITHCWAIVACGSAKATAGVAAVDITNNTITCTGVAVLSNGKLDVSVGTYCTGTITVTSACSTNCTVAGGTWRVTKMYDQVGSAPAISVSYATSPAFVLSGVSSQPTIYCNSQALNATITAISQPSTLLITFEQTSGFTSFAQAISTSGGGGFLGSNGVVNTLTGQNFGGGGTVSATGITNGTGTTDFSHFHRAVLTQSGSGAGNTIMNVDGAQAAIDTGVSGGNSTGTTISPCGSSGNQWSGFITSAATDPTQITGTVANAVTNLTTVPLP